MQQCSCTPTAKKTNLLVSVSWFFSALSSRRISYFMQHVDAAGIRAGELLYRQMDVWPSILSELNDGTRRSELDDGAQLWSSQNKSSSTLSKLLYGLLQNHSIYEYVSLLYSVMANGNTAMQLHSYRQDQSACVCVLGFQCPFQPVMANANAAMQLHAYRQDQSACACVLGFQCPFQPQNFIFHAACGCCRHTRRRITV
jgi:hypothetical protein